MDEKPGHYNLDKKKVNQANHKILSGDEMVEYYLELISKYPSKPYEKASLDIFAFSHFY